MPEATIRIVLVDIQRLAAQIIEDAAAEDPAIRIVAHYSRPTGLVEAAGQAAADFIITGAADHNVAEIGRLLRDRPHVKVLAVAEDERETFLYELRPLRRRIGALSHSNVLQAIRAAVGEDTFEVVNG